MSLSMQAFAKHQYGERTYTSLESILDDPTQLLMSSNAALRRPVGGELDILSASRYPQGLMQSYDELEQNPRKRKATSSDHQLYGGIVFADAASDSNHSSSAEQEQPLNQKKKKSTKRASVNDADDQAENKKQRGRPRLDTQDETAADRRRTQIRLAQRAYRHRKETTISALKQKVTDLQNTIEQMNKTFLNLHDNIVDAGILTSHYSLGRQLQSATEEFVAFSKIASPESDEEEEKIAKITKVDPENLPDLGGDNRRGSAQEPTGTSGRQSRRANVGRGASFDQSSTDAEADVEELPLRTTSGENNLLALTQNTFMDDSNLTGLNDVMSLNASVPETFLYEDPVEKFPIERPLKAAGNNHSYTYSFQETTFARRLHRMCLERAFRNLTNPNIDPDYIKRAFRFTFCFSNRKRMLQRFQEMLKRRAGESLENWNVPFFHIGGAGTHFPRRDDDGNPIYPPNMVSPAKAFGPQPWIQVETPRMEATTQEMLENIGFGGEWYDSHDVEEYLKTKGIYLDGQSSFVEVDLSLLPLVKAGSTVALSSDGSSSGRSPHEASIHTPSPLTGGLADPMTDSFIVRELGEMYAQPSTLFPSLPRATSNGNAGTGTDASDVAKAADPWAEFETQNSPGYTPTFQDLLGRRQSSLTFDVEQFLERMVEGSACLGRAPGFRKDAIDNALALSLQESY